MTAALLNVKSFQEHNQSILSSIKTVDNKSLAIAATDIFNLTQTRLIIICCLVVSTSILKFVTIPIVLLLFPTTSIRRKLSGSLSDIMLNVLPEATRYSSIPHVHKKSQHTSISVLNHNKNPKQNNDKVRASRLSAFHPPPRSNAKSKEKKVILANKSDEIDRSSMGTQS